MTKTTVLPRSSSVSVPCGGMTEDTGLEDALLGEGLPAEAKDHLVAAGTSYHDDIRAEHHLEQARKIAPDHAAVLIGFYRYYFYKNRLQDALEVAKICLKKALRDNKLADDWHAVRRGDAAFDQFDNFLPRFLMFTLKGYAYLNMRLGHIEEGMDAVRKLLELDPKDKIGAGFILDVAARAGQDDDD
ncbi:hypothetical protein LPB41_21090 [Thalassospira sp. MA62]|nr:hypothetical protein [Thalassospira sp. MA62]